SEAFLGIRGIFGLIYKRHEGQRGSMLGQYIRARGSFDGRAGSGLIFGRAPVPMVGISVADVIPENIGRGMAGQKILRKILEHPEKIGFYRSEDGRVFIIRPSQR